jgi:valyl-tRNA synthetase
MYHFKYVLDETPDEYLVVATTRPETMFVDTNLFVNPDDTRYKKYIGKHAINPINGERLLILSDHYIDIKFGTGVMKCTPAHDFNDYKLALEYGVKNFKSVIGCDGKLNQYAKTKYGNYVGLDRIAARTKIVNEIIERDLLDKIEDYESNVGFSQRTGAIVEPLLSLQWFVKMKPIVKNYRLLAKKSKTVFYPDSFKKEIDRWLDNIQDWCISRNLVYGHTIPA